MKKYKVLLDARFLAGRATGLGRYVTHLLDEMTALVHPEMELHGLCFKEDILPSGVSRNLLTGIGKGVRPMRPWQHVIIPWAIYKSGCDLYHYPSYDPPFAPACPFIATCPDIEPIRIPQLFPRKAVLYYKLMGARLRRAERVIVISAHTGKDIVEHLGVDPGKIRVIHLGVASDFHPIPEEKRLGALRSRYRLPERCLLYVGNTMPHKNISRLVSAMALVRKRFPAVPLVIAGSSDKYRPMVAQTIEDQSLSNEVRFLGHVPEEDLPTLYNCASAFLFPSLYEGFGMPVLEAMACGTPVVTSGAASIPEIVGDAAITVDPYDVKSIADGIVHLLENRSEAEKLSRVGIQRAKEFTWRKCAEKHLMVYDEVLKGK